MELENYFDFINDNAIRIRGTRVNIETVLRDYLEGAGPEEIGIRYPRRSHARETMEAKAVSFRLIMEIGNSPLEIA